MPTSEAWQYKLDVDGKRARSSETVNLLVWVIARFGKFRAPTIPPRWFG